MNMSQVCEWLDSQGVTYAICHPDLGCFQGGETEKMVTLAAELVCRASAETGAIITVESVIEVQNGQAAA